MEQWRSTPAAARLVGKSGQTMSHRLSQHCRLPRFQCTWDGLDGYFEPNSFVLFGHKTTSKCTPLASQENDIFASKVANCMKAGATFLLVLADFQRQIGFVSRIMESNRVKGNLLNYMIYNKSWNISFLCYAMIFKSPWFSSHHGSQLSIQIPVISEAQSKATPQGGTNRHRQTEGQDLIFLREKHGKNGKHWKHHGQSRWFADEKGLPS